MAVTAGSIGPQIRQEFAAYFHTSVAAIRQALALVLLIGLPAGDLDLRPDKDLLMLKSANGSEFTLNVATATLAPK